MSRTSLSVAVLATLGLSACAVAPPSGPTGVMALPQQGKSFQVFQQEDYSCRMYASQQTGGAAPAQAASNGAVGSAVVGTALGAGVGAALGSIGGGAGAGAAIGGATGLLAGSVVGANGATTSGAGLQQQYDIAYTQCMYAKGNTVQSAPTGYASAYSAPYPYAAAYPYPYAYPYAYGPSVSVGFGGGWGGWHGWGGGWRPGWRRW